MPSATIFSNIFLYFSHLLKNHNLPVRYDCGVDEKSLNNSDFLILLCYNEITKPDSSPLSGVSLRLRHQTTAIIFSNSFWSIGQSIFFKNCF